MTSTASRNQTDAEILSALDIRTGHDSLTLDRSDPYRIVVLGEYAGQDGQVYVGRAILEQVPGAPTARLWYLGCVGCEAELETGDAGFCPSCRDAMARDDIAFQI